MRKRTKKYEDLPLYKHFMRLAKMKLRVLAAVTEQPNAEGADVVKSGLTGGPTKTHIGQLRMLCNTTVASVCNLAFANNSRFSVLLVLFRLQVL